MRMFQQNAIESNARMSELLHEESAARNRDFKAMQNMIADERIARKEFEKQLTESLAIHKNTSSEDEAVASAATSRNHPVLPSTSSAARVNNIAHVVYDESAPSTSNASMSFGKERNVSHLSFLTANMKDNNHTLQPQQLPTQHPTMSTVPFSVAREPSTATVACDVHAPLVTNNGPEMNGIRNVAQQINSNIYGQPNTAPYGPSTSYTHPTSAHGTQQQPPSLNPSARNNAPIAQFHPYPFAGRQFVDLPVFDGRAEDWPMFLSEFEQTTEMYGYDVRENTRRLRKCLRGEAKTRVEHLTIYPENVPQVIETLRFAFGRPELLIRSQLEKVRALRPISDHELHQLIPFALTVQSFSAFMNFDRTRQHLSNPVLLEELAGKLPAAQRMSWARQMTQLVDVPTILHFSTWLSEEAHYASIATVNTSSTSNQKRYGAQEHRRPKTDYVLATNAQYDNNSKCDMCDDRQHSSLQECSSFKGLCVNERWEVVKQQRRCFCCLKKNHSVSDCRNKKVCGRGKCIKNHHQLLHGSDSPASENEQPNDAVATVLCCETKTPSVYFKTLPVVLYGNNGTSVRTYATFDDCGGVSLIDESIAQQLQLTGKQSALKVKSYRGEARNEPNSRRVSVSIGGTSLFSTKYTLENVHTVPNIDLPVHTVDVDVIRNTYPHLKNLPLTNSTNAKPKVLIGLQHIHLAQPVEEVRGGAGLPSAAKTKLGWVVYGPCGVVVNESATVLMLHEDERDALLQLENTVKDYFTTENFGVKLTVTDLESVAEQRAKLLLTETTQRIDRRFQTGLLWRDDEIKLPDSRPMALNRLRGVERKMATDQNYAARYSSIIDDYVAKGYARKLTTIEAATTTPRTWYLPHFGVRNINKPEKLRLVFDAAATVGGVSLNNALLTGPDQLLSLPGVLAKFRYGPVGICGDIKEMFHQVLIREADQNSQRFLWRHGDVNSPVETYVMQAMTFGAACSPCSAQYVKNMNADDHAAEFPEAAVAIKCHHYMDDYVMSFMDEQEAIRVTKDVIDVHSRGGFELRNFVSNSPLVLDALGCDIDSTDVKIPSDEPHANRILGMYWDTTKDVFTFKFRATKTSIATKTNRPPTKREVLSLIMSTFDPFGILSNFNIYAKLLIKDIFNRGIEWDDPVNSDLTERYRLWLAELENISKCRVNRCYSASMRNTTSLQLHLFADASESAFACVAYWRVRVSADEYHVSFIAGKTKGSPKKGLSIPRMELQAAVLATRLAISVQQWHAGMTPERIVYWTDSRTVVSWIQSDHRRYKQFVGARISEILESTDEKDWRWISTKENVADEATRANRTPRFNADSRWLRGPDFLRTCETAWSPTSTDLECPEIVEEIRTVYINSMQKVSNDIIKFECFSNYNRLNRCIAYCLRFGQPIQGKLRRTGEFTVTELKNAEKALCAISQNDTYGEELDALKQERQVPRSSSIFNLTPYLDQDGLIRINGRIEAAQLEYDVKNPIILAREHPLTKLIIAHYHRLGKHQNNDAIVCEIRQRFWIPHLRAMVRKSKKDCMHCRHQAARPTPALMGQLPIDRLTPNIRPFTYTGLDYFGPINVAVGRRREKRWVALFTCLTVRAIHLELAQDLTTDSCIVCIRNFVNIRGVPQKIRSDNGTNFVGAQKVIRDAISTLDNEKIQSECAKRGIEWAFNCPANPEAGGCWERMVRSVKRVLAVTLHEVAPQVETLRSLLIEAANLVNSRPLTHVPVESSESEPLTPNHFLIGTSNATLVSTDAEGSPHCLRKQWRISQQLANCYWKRWVREYLPELTRRTKWFTDVPPISIGALVLIVDDDAPRGVWRRGIVDEVFAGKDGRVRTATVRTSSGVLRRPVTRLALLDTLPVKED